MKIIGNPDWTNPAVRVKNAIAAPLRNALASAGLWEPTQAADRETIQTETLTLSGDKPAQRRLVYKKPRPQSETVSELRYTPDGMGVVDGKIIERFSVRAPSIGEILRAQKSPPVMIELEQATIIEAETPYTYGDWVGDFIRALITADDVVEPILLPQSLVAKPYVARDIAALGLSYVSHDCGTHIQSATVLRKCVPSYYWSADDVAAYRKAFNVRLTDPINGSLLYLGRYETISESVQRQYPTEAVARIVESLGGIAFDARQSSPEKFTDLARHAQTVIADQGSALFGVMQWRTKNVIELTRRDWWHSANLFIAKGSGVENYAVIAVDDLDETQLRTRIEGHLREFGALD